MSKRGLVLGEGVKIRAISLSRKIVECPQCGTESRRHSLGHRWLRDLGQHHPVILEVTYSKHYCPKCTRFFNIPMEHIAPAQSSFTNRVKSTAINLVVNQDHTLEEASVVMEKKYHVHVPAVTIHDWVATSV